MNARFVVRPLFAALLSGFVLTSHAGYYVIDDDLLPTCVTAKPQTVQSSDHYQVNFQKFTSGLGANGMAVINALLPQLRRGPIRIVARPDAVLNTTSERLTFLARNRGINIRDYLIRQGIPASSIVMEVDNTPNPQTNGVTYPSDIYVGRSEPEAIVQQAPCAAPISERYQREEVATTQPSRRQPALYQPPVPPTPIAQPVAPQPASTPSSSDQLIQYINGAVASGKMLPTVALQLLRALAESESPKGRPPQPAAQMAPAYAPPPTTAPPALLVASPALTRKPTWTLNKELTLRDNINAWSKSAGWNPTQWDASNYYEVGRTVTMDGEFPDVLRQIVAFTGLNICSKMREKVVRVTDPNVSCEN